jgi:hypothetical protein
LPPVTSPPPPPRQHGSDAWLYLAAAITYIAASMYQKFLLNWIIGPLWLVAWMVVVPAIGRAIGRVRRRGSTA